MAERVSNGIKPPTVLALDTNMQPDGEPQHPETISETPNEVCGDDNEDSRSVRTTTAYLFSDSSRAASRARDGQRRKLGLDINRQYGWSGSDYDDYDVVTVHGIRDDYDTAWTDNDGVWWVRNELFKDLSTRQVDYAYNIDEDSILYEPDGLRIHAQTLITKYAEIRRRLEETETDRPIIWICHDLGGTMVKEALSVALAHPDKYGKIAMLTTAIIFLGTPHREHSLDDLEDQLHKLVLLPGPEIRNRSLKKIKGLASQVTRINEEFTATKLLDRVAIFTVFCQNIPEGIKQRPVEDDNKSYSDIGPENEKLHEAVTPFPRFVCSFGQSFEAVGRARVDDMDHLDLVRGDAKDEWITTVSGVFNMPGCPIKVNYRILPLQARLLSLAPPTRALGIPYDPVLPRHPVVNWIYKHQSYAEFTKPPTAPRVLHLHGNGKAELDIAKLSRQFFIWYDTKRTVTSTRTRRMPERTVIYFEFDRRDSRYNSISSMLLYFINMLAWRGPSNYTMAEELKFLSDTHAWSLEDLYHLFSIFRDTGNENETHQFTLFISCFDQCPEDQRGWFLQRIRDVHSYSDGDYRVIVSTSRREDLAMSKPFPHEAVINLEECEAIRESTSSDAVAEEFRSTLSKLIARRPIYEALESQIRSLLQQCHNAPYMGRIILNWLGHYARGVPRAELEERIYMMSPVTPKTLVKVFMSSLDPEQRQKTADVFNWVKHALEPWTPESLAEALAVHRFSGQEPSFDDLDPASLISDIEKTLGGMIIVEHRDIRFSHPSFYDLAEIGMEDLKSPEEQAAKVNSEIAEACLRYFFLVHAQETLENWSPRHLEGGLWTTQLGATWIAHRRTSMAEYAVRFWPQHYRFSGQFKPSQLVCELMSDREARTAWEVSFYTMSNPFTRMQRGYISPLPTFAMLDLEDLIDEQLNSDRGRPWLEIDCWFAITEAARAGKKHVVQKLLERVPVNLKELQSALSWAAGFGEAGVVDILLRKIPELNTFEWPENIMQRAVAAALNNLVESMLQSGCDINDTGDYWNAPPSVVAAWWSRVCTMELLLKSDPKPDLALCARDGDPPILLASLRGNPAMVAILLSGGADVTTKIRNESQLGAVEAAVRGGRYKALELLVKAEARARIDSDEQDDEQDDEQADPPLVMAAEIGLKECIRVLLANGADPNIKCDSGSALYKAVAGGHTDIVRMLLENDPKADPKVSPSDKDKLLIRAVCTRDCDIVELLIDHGVEIDFVDPHGVFCKTPLSRAAYENEKEIVELLLEKGADVNYTGDNVSDSSLFTAVYQGHVSIARLLLEKGGDPKWTASDRWNSLHAAYDLPEMVPELLEKDVDIDANSNAGTILHLAARHNHPKTITALLARNSKPSIDLVYGEDGNNRPYITEQLGCTALLMACRNHNLECVELLLKAGADPYIRSKDGDNAFDCVLRDDSTSDQPVECLKVLVAQHNRVALDAVDEHGNICLHKITKNTQLPVVQLLVEAGVPMHLQNQDGYTPLSIAISKGNTAAAKYLIDKGSSVNVYSPRFGSLLHLACAQGSLELVELLLCNGADVDTVDPEYGESLLYTALGIENEELLTKMVRYLVDDAHVPLNKLGGRFGYPIIRAADISKSSVDQGTKLLKFLIRRKAALDVADDQGRRAVHLAAKSWWSYGLEALLEAGADINARDKFGRMPIHIAASTPFDDCTRYLLKNFGEDKDKYKDLGVDAPDNDNWTPLLWAARSGDCDSIVRFAEDEHADIWTKGRTYDTKSEWSALKLANFAGRSDWVKEYLAPKELMRTKPNGSRETEVWNEYFHKSKVGDVKMASCWSCFVEIRGIQWKCIDCAHDVSLCFKCYGHRSDIHNLEHSFEEIGPLYTEERISATSSSAGPNRALSESGQLQVEEEDLEDNIAPAVIIKSALKGDDDNTSSYNENLEDIIGFN